MQHKEKHLSNAAFRIFIRSLFLAFLSSALPLSSFHFSGVIETHSSVNPPKHQLEIKPMLLAEINKHAMLSLVRANYIIPSVPYLPRFCGPSNISGLVSLIVIDPVYGPRSMWLMPNVRDNPVSKCDVIVFPFVAHFDSSVVVIPVFYPIRLAPALCITPSPIKIGDIFPARFSMRSFGFFGSFYFHAPTAIGVLTELMTNDYGFFSTITSASPSGIIFWRRTIFKSKNNQFPESHSCSIFNQFSIHPSIEMLSLEEVNKNA